MFERFTDNARRVIVLAQEEARRLHHNYIGTEHIVLGLLGEPRGIAAKVLFGFGMSLDGARAEVIEAVGEGKSDQSGHIPFTPRAKKTLELALREALQLGHNYIGTEHLLLGVIREPESVGSSIVKKHSDLLAVRLAVLDQLAALSPGQGQKRRWERATETAGGTGLNATPAADAALAEAARVAVARPVGSHDLLFAALGDPDTAAARVLIGFGIDLDQVRQALRDADVTGTSDELPEEAGRRQMSIHVTDERVTLEITDQAIITAARAAVDALGDDGGVIRGDVPEAGSLTAVWRALIDSLATIQRRGSSLSPETIERRDSSQAD
jgi:ATP-dependent Clp protease ATP-binding subunit ClpA